jgi:hypothetical protein
MEVRHKSLQQLKWESWWSSTLLEISWATEKERVDYGLTLLTTQSSKKCHCKVIHHFVCNNFWEMTKFCHKKGHWLTFVFLEQVHEHQGKWLCPVYFGWSTTTFSNSVKMGSHVQTHWFSQGPIKQNDCFWLVSHNDWFRWWHLNSLSPSTFLFEWGLGNNKHSMWDPK